MPLTDTAIKNAKPRARPYKLSDERGLHLLIQPQGGRLWRMKYRADGADPNGHPKRIEKLLSFGSYPDVTLKAARALRDAARKQLAEGIDPGQLKKEAKIASALGAANSFAAVAEEYIQRMEQEGRADATLNKVRWLAAILKPAIGARPVAEVKPHELLAVMKKIEQSGKRETAGRLRSFASRVFRYAVATARASDDPAHMLLGALVPPNAKHHAAITEPKALGELLRAIDGYQGQPATLFALRLAPHIFQRPGEVRQMEWSEVDFDKAVWTIPATRMKMRQAHHVPLSSQALAILRDIHSLTGSGKLVFPSIRSFVRPMSENTINAALRRLGYGADEMTAHGFRSTASSLLNESGKWNPDAIERALAHREGNQVRAAYHRSTYWDERVQMAQWWSDHLDKLREGGEVVRFPGKVAG
ncbi:MAG TPA: integrase arm-type DNA-binding domain-containing protein [Devosia sp.]|uniref:tyrosine-type recombinase/integrase n=1 Tax=Devosia sp. TaxID=1871048 RepID=UPI002DDD67FD|nr:integrase arm-type DNA-binding domain-containing protein [Devosia sp.]HEV2517042.1 integrase arm-type DNA-binding domain-containing protein [Devosia sp.]